MTLAVNILLWLVVGVLAAIAAYRGRVLLNDGARDGAVEFIHLLPRIAIGVVGSGFIAEALPDEWIAPWLGPESGFLGVAIATLGGALTPGGPVVGFSIGAAALKSGAGEDFQIVAAVLDELLDPLVNEIVHLDPGRDERLHIHPAVGEIADGRGELVLIAA